jgi:hypothetical protein
MTRLRSYLPCVRYAAQETIVADREKITDGPNERAIDEPIAGTAPGIPDEAMAPGEDLPEAPSEEEVARIAKKLGAPIPTRDG